MTMKKSLILVLSVALLASLSALSFACTTAVFSGKSTLTGRPMLWKVRDTDYYHNYVSRHQSPKGWWYIGISNVEDKKGEQIWSGHNERGFGIMNSASFNVNKGDPASIADREGYVMRRALEECETLKDFEQLLDAMVKPMGLATHFGVIDAKGGAAIYEVNNYTWTKEDANTAPGGYIVRSNYSETGEKDRGLGYVRACAARELLSELDGPVTIGYITNSLSRSLYNAQLGIDYGTEYLKRNSFAKGFILTDDLMARYDSASVTITEGVAPGEDTADAVSWIQVAQPYVCPLVPIWAWAEVPAELALPQKDAPGATIAELALEIKGELFPLHTVEQTRYLYLPVIISKDGTGLMQRIQALEQEALPTIHDARSREQRTALTSAYIERCMVLLRSAAGTKGSAATH